MLDDDDIVRYVYNDQGQRVLKLLEDEEDNTAYVNPFFIVRGDDDDGFYSKHVMIGSVRIASRLVSKDDYDDDEDKATYFYHSDHLGSTGYVSDHNGKLAEHIGYFPFGESWIEQQRDEMCMDARMSRAQGSAGATMDDLSPEKWRFTGKELDSETGLYYFGARYYDPRTSVWQSADPILGKYLPNSRGDNSNLPGEGGVFTSLNISLYSYVGNNPLIYIDPDGRVRWRDAFSSSMGIVSNSAGVFVGGTLTAGGYGLMVAPEPVLTKLAGAGSLTLGSVILTKSIAGVGLNSANLRAAIEDREPYVESSLARIIADEISPGSETARGIADITDLSLDFASGRAPVGTYIDDLGRTVTGNLGKLENIKAARKSVQGTPAMITEATGTSL